MLMFRFVKNRFLFIILISVATLVLLVVGALSLYKDTSYVFENEGYIIEATTKVSNKYYFSANTKYKENVDEKITFSDTDSNKVAVDPASFVHYLNGNVSFLQRGAIVNLGEITSPMVSYYNVTNLNMITYENGSYTVTSNGKKINLESFVGRISDQKYLVAGSNLSLKVPKVEDRITGDYFEILFVEKGIVKIDNQEASYQVTAQDSYIYVGDNIVISLGDGKIFYDGEAKMLLSQITIHGDENIDLDVEKNNSSGGGGTGSGEAGETNGTNEENGNGTGENESGDNSNGVDDNGDNSTANNGEVTGGNNTSLSPQIELIEANVTSTMIDLSLQLNNASLATGTITAYLTNVATGTREYAKNIDLVNGTFNITKESLSPSTEYVLTIVETGSGMEKQYFQKTFKTEDLGISLERVYATDSSLAYRIVFDENTDVTRVHISIYDNNGMNDSITNSEFMVSSSDLDNSVVFEGLKSNTSYSVCVDTVWINNAAYSDVYTINRIDTTLKKTPKISGVSVDSNSEEVKFTIKLGSVEDIDNSIVSYTYNVYLADDVTLDNLDPVVQYSVTKNDSDALVLNLNEIDELKTGVDYRCRIVAQYYDNEMIREVSTDYSGNFLIRSKPNISFELESATMNKVIGTISLIDANCTVPMSGRTCSNLSNRFTLRYYKLKEEETTENDTSIVFDPRSLTSKITLSDLSSNTTYAVKVFGNYYDDDNVLHSNVQIGDTFYVTTDKSENLHFEVIGDNVSGENKDGTENSANVVTFDAKLSAPQDSTIMDEISTVTLNLYSGRYNVQDKLIGTYKMTDKSEIEDFFSNITIRNSMFTDVTSNQLGKIDSLAKLIQLTNNATGTLNAAYTVEVEDVYDSTGRNKITVEDNVYTFNLTSSYYLDTRIETNPSYNYVTTGFITKENLTDEEYESLSKTVKNLDSLNDDTIVGLTIENSLSDIFVDSAFTYEKVVVNYTIYNVTTKKMIKTISVDMGNKYQPKTQTVYLDSSELDDGKNYFTRGYRYQVGYTLNFTTEDGSNPVYTHDRLYRILSIERQAPIYTQYVSTSDSKGITYRYSFTDIDGALMNGNFYYTLGEDKDYQELADTLVSDGDYHEVTIPIDENIRYSLYYARKNTSDEIEYVSIASDDFETEYSYDSREAYTIINDNDNVLKLRLESNEVIDRATVYKVMIQADGVGEYTRYFLASKLSKMVIDSGSVDEEGNPVMVEYPYIAIDYANISKFMGHDMKVYVYSYYDSGLVGIDQNFSKGMYLKNGVTNKNLNIYNGGTGTTSLSQEDTDIMGMYLLKENYDKGSSNIYLYNHLILLDSGNSVKYNPLLGAAYYSTSNLEGNVGVRFDLTYTNAGIVFTNGRSNYSGYQARVLKEANLKTLDNTYRFDAIVPTIDVATTHNTINSIQVDVLARGIYGQNQFTKDGKAHNKIYVEFYSDENLENKLTTLTSDIVITGDDVLGYSATIDSVVYSDLAPATTYYFAVYAYIDDQYTRLYDSSSTLSYVTKTYSSMTLDANGLISSIKFSVQPTKYLGEASQKELQWKLNLKNTDNYKIRFELYEPNGTITEVDPDTGEDIITTNFRAVNFDGTEASSCDVNLGGGSSDGYVRGCYIAVDKEDVGTINQKDQVYQFSGNSFVFGDNYYKLIVYAIPYTNGAYKEDDKVILYQNDSLANGMVTSNGVTSTITIPMLDEATFSLKDLITGYTEDDGYYISFVPDITDNHFVIKYGTYTIKLKNEKGEVVAQKDSVDAKLTPQSEIRFTGLSSNTLYYIELSYETYRNNVGYTESQKIATIPFTDFTYTPIDAGITLGTITAGQATSKGVTLTYNGSSNMVGNITRVHYTISLKGGSSKVSGDYRVDDSHASIFTIAADKTPKLTIDVSDSNFSDNTSFTFKPGNTYIISTQYYYGEDETLLQDQDTKNTTFTTILNL